MLISKLLLFFSLLIAVKCECEHEWVAFRDVNLIRSQGLIAGNFKRNVPAYIGQGINSRGIMVPGRIQTENPKGLYYTANSKSEKTTNTVEFLRKNRELNYTWVAADSRKCINNAVTIENTYFIGRTKVGDFTYVGEVQVGERGLKYANQQGHEVLTNDYEVLTCVPISKQDLLAETSAKLSVCIESEENLSKENTKLSSEVSQLSREKNSLESYKKLLEDNNKLLNEKIKRLEAEGGSSSGCTKDPDEIYDQIDVRATAPPLQTCINSGPSQAQLNQLSSDLNSADRQINSLQQTNNRLQQQLVALNSEKDTILNELADKNNEVSALQAQIAQLRNQQRAAVQCVGVDGCLHALESSTSLSQAEITRLLLFVKSKAPVSTQNKLEG